MKNKNAKIINKLKLTSKKKKIIESQVVRYKFAEL